MAKHLVREFPSIGWNLGLVYKLLQKVFSSTMLSTLSPSHSKLKCKTKLNLHAITADMCCTQL